MGKTNPQAVGLAVVMAAIGFSLLAAGIIMLLTAHSSQARPRLSNLTVPDIPTELDRRHLEQAATYRDLNDPILRECIDPTPHSAEEPRNFYVTVAEDDGNKMLDVISYNAAINDSLIKPLYDGHQISYHDGWETWLETLDPALPRNNNRIHPGYTSWAKRAADIPVPPTPKVRCAALPNTIRLYVDEQRVGSMSDSDTKNGSIIFFVLAPFILAIAVMAYIGRHETLP